MNGFKTGINRQRRERINVRYLWKYHPRVTIETVEIIWLRFRVIHCKQLKRHDIIN